MGAERGPDLVSQRHAGLLRHDHGTELPTRSLEPGHQEREQRRAVAHRGPSREAVGQHDDRIPPGAALGSESVVGLGIEPAAEIGPEEIGGPVGRGAPDVHGLEPRPLDGPDQCGRVERLNRTLQGRLVNELRVAGITTLEAANTYLREVFIPDYQTQFTRPPADPASAFAPLGDVDLDALLADETERVVGDDNVVRIESLALQLAETAGGVLEYAGGVLLPIAGLFAYAENLAYDRETDTLTHRPVGWTISGYLPGEDRPVDGWDELIGYYQGRTSADA